MPRPRVGDCYQYMTAGEVCRDLGITEYHLNTRLAQGIFPPPAMVDEHGVRYFDKVWLQAARKTLKEWRARRPQQGGLRAQQHEEGPMPSKTVESPEEPVVVTPQPGIVPVICYRCQGQISWDVTRGAVGRCPYCRTLLRLRT